MLQWEEKLFPRIPWVVKTTFVIKILSIDIVVSVFVDTVYGDIIIKCKNNFGILLAVPRSM